MLVILELLILSFPLVPFSEQLTRIARECATRVNTQHLIHNLLHRFQMQHPVDYRGKRCSHRPHEISAREHPVAQTRRMLAVFKPCLLNYIAYSHFRWASDLTPFAVKAIFQRLVIEIGLLKTVALSIGSGLLRTRKIMVHSRHRTIYRANRALYTLIKIGACSIIYPIPIHDDSPFH